MPAISFLKVCPNVAHLQSRQGVRIEISFCPPVFAEQRKQTAPLLASEEPPSEESPEENETEKKEKKKSPSGPGQKAGHTTAGSTSEPQKHDGQLAAEVNDQNTERGAEEGGTEGGDSEKYPLVPLFAGTIEESDNNNVIGGGAMGGGHLRGEDRMRRGESGEQRQENEEEEWSRHGRWMLPCFLKGEERDLPPLALQERWSHRPHKSCLCAHASSFYY